MIEQFKKSVLIYTLIILALGGAAYETIANMRQTTESSKSMADYSQPPLSQGVYPWSVRSIDTQVISKHWPNVTRASIIEQVGLVSKLGVNYIAIGTPYDKIDEMRMWSEEIHKLGLHVWYRSHWDEWEGDDGKPATMTPEDYLYRTSQFIQNNPDLFQSGDSLTVAVEPEQVGVGLGKRFLTWDQYRTFMLAQVIVANESFDKIGLKGKVYTNWLSVNGWVVENQYTPELVDKLGLIVVDHFVGQSKTIGEFNDPQDLVRQTMHDLDTYHARWNVPILLGEWGYQIFQPVTDENQANVIDLLLSQLRTRNYLVGMNYWVHMGNTASIMGDEFGTNLKYRKGATVLKSFYEPLHSGQF